MYMTAVRSIADVQDPLMRGLSNPTPSLPYAIKTEPFSNTALYLCNKRKEAHFSENGSGKIKPSMEALRQYYNALRSRKPKETLSSFLPDVPGDTDSVDIPDTTLRGLIDHPPVGGAEYLPLTGQALLGFRLAPGSLPEQYRMDTLATASLDVKHHHKKKKRHKHRAIDKTEDRTVDQVPPASITSHPAPTQDAFLFISSDPSQGISLTGMASHPPPPIPPAPSPHSHILTSAASTVVIPSKMPYNTMVMPQTGGTSVSTMVGLPMDVSLEKKRKKKHENGDGQTKKKKKRDKEKKKKKDKHHTQDPPLVQASSLPVLPPSAHPHTSFPHPPI